MPDGKQLEMLRKGSLAFQDWRERHAVQEIDLSGADLRQQDLQGINLEKANLAGANLQGAVLAQANLASANLQKANLAGANLEGALLDDANLALANMEGASLKRARLEHARFQQANLSEANLSEALARNADFTQATLRGADLRSANLEKATLSSTDLERAVLRDTHLTDAGLHCADLSRADLTGAVATRARFSQATLGRAKLDAANCRRANFEGAAAQSASLHGAILNEATMAHAVLKQADLRRADLRRAVLDHARLQKARIDGADFFEANLTAANMAQVAGAADAKNLDTVTIEEPVHYFDSCTRKWPDRYASWEVIRTIGNLRLFAVSYSLLAFLLAIFYAVGLYNEKILVARQWAERARASNTLATRLLAEEILRGLSLFLLSLDTVVLFGSTVILVVASIIYTFGCPAEIKDFTRPQWCYQLNRSLVHYWSLAWKGRGWRIACGLLYSIGGAGFVPIIGYKLVLALIYVWKYVDVAPLGQ